MDNEENTSIIKSARGKADEKGDIVTMPVTIKQFPYVRAIQKDSGPVAETWKNASTIPHKAIFPLEMELPEKM